MCVEALFYLMIGFALCDMYCMLSAYCLSYVCVITRDNVTYECFRVLDDL